MVLYIIIFIYIIRICPSSCCLWDQGDLRATVKERKLLYASRKEFDQTAPKKWSSPTWPHYRSTDQRRQELLFINFFKKWKIRKVLTIFLEWTVHWRYGLRPSELCCSEETCSKWKSEQISAENIYGYYYLAVLIWTSDTINH